jgi:hypothetical protein
MARRLALLTGRRKGYVFWVKYPTKIAYQTFLKCKGFAVNFVHSPVIFWKCDVFEIQRNSPILLMNDATQHAHLSAA